MALKRPPGPKGVPVLGSVPEFNRERLNFLLNNARQYGDIVYYKLLNYHIYQLNHPDYIQEVLVNEAEQVNKGDLDKAVLSPTVGNGILTSEGEFHRSQRKLMQPAFHHKRIEAYGQVMTDYTARLLNTWRDGQMVDIHEAMTTLTMQIVSKSLYDADVNDESDAIGEAVHTINQIGGQQFQQGFVPPKWLPIAQNRDAKHAIQQLDALMMPIIEERRKSGEDKGDLLSMLLLAQDEVSGSGMTDRQVRDEAVTLFVAGHETTSNLLSWAWHLLAQHPKAEAKLHEEVNGVLGGVAPTLSDLARLPYTDWVIKEALRLNPPAWILNGRKPLTDLQIGGYTIPKGSLIFLSPYVMHRDPRYFDNPSAFIPERWADGLEKRIPRYAYFPFGGGPRVCIGNQFALMEAKLVLATIAGRYSLSLASSKAVELDPLVTLRPKDGIAMRLSARQVLPVQTVKAPTTAVHF
ncbi:MAG: cytochrome P450 [Anaerolineae bacterium]